MFKDTKLFKKYYNFWNCTEHLKNLSIFTPAPNSLYKHQCNFTGQHYTRQYFLHSNNKAWEVINMYKTLDYIEHSVLGGLNKS